MPIERIDIITPTGQKIARVDIPTARILHGEGLTKPRGRREISCFVAIGTPQAIMVAIRAHRSAGIHDRVPMAEDSKTIQRCISPGGHTYFQHRWATEGTERPHPWGAVGCRETFA